MGKILVSGLAVTVLGATAYGYSTLSALDGVQRANVIDDTGAKPGEQPADGSLDILLVGRDARMDAQGNPLPSEVLRELRAGANGDDLTDTLIVLRIPNGQQAVKAFSIPRDSYVDQPGGKDKINAAFGHAKASEAARLRAQGVTDKARIEADSLTAARRGARQAVENLTGLTIDHYAEVNLLSFYEISQAVGGVDVCLNKATKEANSGADFPAGPQTISGADALAFVRQRENLPRGDLDRVRRQQVFLAGLAGKVLSQGTLTSPGKLSDLIAAVKKSVVLDGNWNLLDFVRQMKGLSSGGIQFDTVPVVNPDYRYNPAHPSWTAVQVDPVQVKAFAAALIGKPPVTGPPVTVDVSNSGDAAGLAVRVAAVLTAKGFVEGKTGNASAHRRTSLVRFGADLAARGGEIATLLGGLATEQAADVPPGHIEVLLGQVYTGPGATGGGGGAAASGPPPITSGAGNCVN